MTSLRDSLQTLLNPDRQLLVKSAGKLTIEEIEPSNRRYPGIIFQPLREVGNQILNVENLSASVDGRQLFDKVTFTVNKGDKIAFLSRDPLAVTHFFEIINGNLNADKGNLNGEQPLQKRICHWKTPGFSVMDSR